MITDDIKGAYKRSKWALVLRGLFGIALGIVIFARPLASVAIFALVIAIWALFDGIVSIVHSFDLRSVTSNWWVMLLSGIVSACFGVAAFYYYPILSLSFAVLWTGWWLITGGAIGIYAAFQERNAGLSWGWTLTFGILAFGFGVLAIMYPGVTLAWLMSTIAAFGIVGGIVLLVGAGKMQSFEEDVRRAVRSPSHA